MKWLKRIGISIIVLVIIVFFSYFWFHITDVEVIGNKIYSKKEIKASVFSRRFSDNELALWFYENMLGVGELTFVENIDIEYSKRNKVVIRVYEKTISGCIKYMGQYIYFDKDGVVLQSMGRHRKGIPIVTGIDFGNFTIGEKFDVEDEGLFSSIMNVSQLISHYKVSVQRIHIKDNKLTLYSGKVTVYLGKHEHYDDAVAVLPDILGKEAKASGYVDLSDFEMGDVVVFKKNKNSDTAKKVDESQQKEK